MAVNNNLLLILKKGYIKIQPHAMIDVIFYNNEGFIVLPDTFDLH